jgi:hypothetical protein
MKEHRALILASACSLALPFLLVTLTSSDDFVGINFLLLAAPQLIVIGLALVFPSLRRGAVLALILLTVLLLGYWWLTHSDPNGGMLLGFYYMAAGILVIVRWMFPGRRSRAS